MRILVAGWFSFKDMGTTAGDLIAKDIICNWLAAGNFPFDVAGTEQCPMQFGVDWQQVNPLSYSDIVFVCGPFGNGWPITNFLTRFSHARLTGVNLSLLQPLSEWNPFRLLFERDSSVASNPDLTFFSPPPSVPVVGVILAHKQKEYGDRALHDKANSAISQLLQTSEASIIPIDTALPGNKGGLRTAREVESIIAKMDIIVTTRLHGLVLGLKNGVPVLPIDPIAGGAKVTKQVNTLGWPVLFTADVLPPEALCEAFEFCKSEAAMKKAVACAQQAKDSIEAIRQVFLKEMVALLPGEYVHDG